jgi:hypothetical protein
VLNLEPWPTSAQPILRYLPYLHTITTMSSCSALTEAHAQHKAAYAYAGSRGELDVGSGRGEVVDPDA